jgi:hypothetical protein
VASDETSTESAGRGNWYGNMGYVGGAIALPNCLIPTVSLNLRVFHSDFADEYPSAEVIGTDLSPIQPPMVPANLRFEIDDACGDWTYPENHFDLIHVRALYGAVADWPAFYATVLKHLRPGGWFDQLEMSIQFRSDEGTVTDDHILAVWSRTFIEAGERCGKTFRIADLAKGYLEEAGFNNVVEKRFKLPVGGWSRDRHFKKLGQWNRLHCEEGIEGWAMALLTRVMGVSPAANMVVTVSGADRFSYHEKSGPTQKCRFSSPR